MKKVLITGASSGIGRACALTFSREGYEVYLTGRNEERLKSVSKELTGPSKYYLADFNDSNEIKKVIEKINHQCSEGGLNALINNAGMVEYGDAKSYSLDNWHKLFQVNFFSAIEISNGLHQALSVAKPSFIVNISSTLGIKPIANTAAYSASKAAMDNWTKTTALEWAKDGIRVNSINPGIVHTPIHQFHNNPEMKKDVDPMQPLGRTGEPDEIASMAYFLCQKSSEWTTGTNIIVDGGIQLL